MAGEYERAISIKEAIDSIYDRNYLLPAIQRKYIWSSQQICVLFDSIMRKYPISTFMMWEIKDGQIKNNHKFYGFLESYCQRFNEDNPFVKTDANTKDFKAIIDGQQRLTSLYIGLRGTYAYKQPRVWWPSAKDDSILPPRKLYLDLMKPMNSEDDESLMYYNFRFLTEKQYQDSLNNKGQHHWFCLHNILGFEQVDGGNNIWNKIVFPYLKENGLESNEFTQQTLGQLYDVIRCQKTIHYFNETNQDIDHVLDVFIRTNSGGTKLDFSDLLMSIAIASWEGDFRKEIDDLTNVIYQNSEMGFYVGRDWILKTCLMLIDVDVRFKVNNFTHQVVEKIQKSWSELSECIKETFKLIKSFGINSQSLTSLNALIPICYFLYQRNSVYKEINNPIKHHELKSSISQWLYMALLKGVFGGQADSILTSMREVLSNELDFPLYKIIERYKATNKDLRFDNDFIESLLDTQNGEGKCRVLLHLLFPELKSSEIYDIDHLHPSSAFNKLNIKKSQFLQSDEILKQFYLDPKHWNSIPNLHLLNKSQNRSKQNKHLSDWINTPGLNIKKKDLLIGDDTSLDFCDFKDFYIKRRSALKERLESRVFMTSSLLLEPEPSDSDEEVPEE